MRSGRGAMIFLIPDFLMLPMWFDQRYVDFQSMLRVDDRHLGGR
jgi:hypothetical protein